MAVFDVSVKPENRWRLCRNPCCGNKLTGYAYGGKAAECNTCWRRRRVFTDSAKHDAWKQRRNKYNRDLRRSVVDALGGACACCGVSRYEFLAVDHIHGGGNRHRQRKPGGNAIWLEIQSEGFPRDKYQILCHNCNMARGFYGDCPHDPCGGIDERTPVGYLAP